MYEYNLTVIGKLDKLPIKNNLWQRKLNIRLENGDKFYIFRKLKYRVPNHILILD